MVKNASVTRDEGRLALVRLAYRRQQFDGDEWVLNGEKWFSSSASVADIAVVIAKTDQMHPDTSNTAFVVELPNPGYQILRNIETMLTHTELGLKLGVATQELYRARVPRENLLGGRGQGFNMGQHRLAYGRLRHGMHNVAMAQQTLDLAAEHVSQRQTFEAVGRSPRSQVDAGGLRLRNL